MRVASPTIWYCASLDRARDRVRMPSVVISSPLTITVSSSAALCASSFANPRALRAQHSRGVTKPELAFKAAVECFVMLAPRRHYKGKRTVLIRIARQFAILSFHEKLHEPIRVCLHELGKDEYQGLHREMP